MKCQFKDRFTQVLMYLLLLEVVFNRNVTLQLLHWNTFSCTWGIREKKHVSTSAALIRGAEYTVAYINRTKYAWSAHRQYSQTPVLSKKKNPKNVIYSFHVDLWTLFSMMFQNQLNSFIFFKVRFVVEWKMMFAQRTAAITLHNDTL